MADATRDDEPVLVDRHLDERLAADGLVVLPLVPAEELRAVEEAYWDLVPRGEEGIVVDYLRTDRALARRLARLMDPVWERVVPEVFAHHHPVYTSFVVKHPSEDSSLFLHRDLHVDDERFRRTLALWMPFVDTGPELDNGPLEFVRGSEHIRYGAYGPNAVGLFAPYHDQLAQRAEPLAVAAGSAVVYDARMLHASGPNRSATPRLAVGCLLARRDQPVIQVMATGRRHRVVYEVDHDYFVDAVPQQIAERGIPEQYPVIAEYDEEPATSADVLGPLLANGGLRREVVVPDDMCAYARWDQQLAATPGRRPRHDRDLAVAASDLAPVGAHVAGNVAVDAVGAVGALDLVRRSRRVGAAPAAVPDVVVPLDLFRTRDASLVVLDQDARLFLSAPARRGIRYELVVVECPAVKAGAAASGRSVELDLGLRLGLGPDGPLRLWNDGPGPLVLVVRARPALRSRGGGAGDEGDGGEALG